MNYIVIELQTDANLVTSVLYTVYDNKDQAESKYHTILAYAAVNPNLFIHAASIIMPDGSPYMHSYYRRDEVYNNAHQAPEPEEPEVPEGE